MENYCLATTDINTKTIYLSEDLYGSRLITVYLHELGHVVIDSFHLINDIHRMVKPEYWVEMEEWICNFVANYGTMIFQNAYKSIGYSAIELIPSELEKVNWSKEVNYAGSYI